MLYLAGFCSAQLSCRLSRAKKYHRRSPAETSPPTPPQGAYNLSQQVLQEYLERDYQEIG